MKIKSITEENIGLVLFSLSIIYLIVATYTGIKNPDIWYDEIFSLQMGYYPLDNLINYGINDVHPLLYYFILKFFIHLSAVFNVGDVYLVCKIVSLIPFYLLAVLSFTKVKKLFGMLTCGIFALCIISMPQMMFFAVEIRMYGWALFFITASFIYFIDFIQEPSIRKLAALTLFGICSAYTHYFAAVGIICIYLIFFVYIVLKKKELIKHFIASSIVAVLAYIPWLPILLEQFGRVSEEFWIEPITKRTLLTYLYYLFSPPTRFYTGEVTLEPDILGTLMIIAFIVLIIYTLKYKKDDDRFWILSLIAFASVPFIGVVVSRLMSPVFFMRYFIPIMGLLWLSFSILLRNAYSRKEIFYPVLLLVIVVGLVCTCNFITSQELDHQNSVENQRDLNEMFGSGNIIISDLNTTKFRLGLFYLPNNNNTYYTNESNIENLTLDVLKMPDTQNKIRNGATVFFVDHRESNFTQLEMLGVTLENVTIENGHIHNGEGRFDEIDSNETFKLFKIRI